MRTPQPVVSACARLPIRVLVIGSNDQERLALRSLAADTAWHFHEAATWREAKQLLKEEDIETVITARDLSDGAWTDVLDHLRSRPNPPRVIVYSPVADDAFWLQVLDAGGYDVLATPFDRSEVFRATHIAWLSWSRTARMNVTSETLDERPAQRAASRWFLPAVSR